jgi:glycosyltransferase involved in cell wall biosynthesis
LRLAEPLGKLFREKNVKALWIQGWQVMAYWQAVWQAHRAGVQVWLRGESNDLAPSPASLLKRLAKRFLLNQLFRRIDHFLYIGQANKRLYESYGVRSEQLHATLYAVDNERFAQQARRLLNQRNDIRRLWNISDNAFCVLFAGKFTSGKRPRDLIAATSSKQFNNKERPMHLLFVGSGEQGAALRNLCHVAFDADSNSYQSENNGGINGSNAINASFTGFLNQTEISKAYIAADCLVLPSDRETWGLVVNEAMVSGLPCLASDKCGCSEDMIHPIDPHLCFPVGDTDAIASALIRCMEQPHLSELVQEHVTNFNIATSVAMVKKLYESTRT